MKSNMQSAERKRRNKEPLSKKLPLVFNMVIKRSNVYGNSREPIPTHLLLVRSTENDASADQLFLDQLPVPRESWSFDKRDRVLHWKGAFGGGHLIFAHDSCGCTGVIGSKLNPINVFGSSQVQFTCSVALNCGISIVETGDAATGMSYDPTSAQWRDADWVKDRLQLTYIYKSNGPVLPPSFTFEFQDNQTFAPAWTPDEGSFMADLEMADPDNGPVMVWDLTFKSLLPPPPDKGFRQPTGPASVYPFWMQATEDSIATMITGAMTTQDPPSDDSLVGFEGVRTSNGLNGYYRTKDANEVFGVFNGKMTVDGKAVPKTYVGKNKLYWKELEPALQTQLHLPASGSLQFNANCTRGTTPDLKTRVTKVSVAQAIAYITQSNSIHPSLAASLRVAQDDGLSIITLLNMTPYVYLNKGWTNEVQDAVTADLGTIMNSTIEPTMWKLLFPTVDQPVLTGELAIIANSPVPGVTDPKAWYTSLSTAVLTQGMANGDDKNCKNMNGPRAGAWLQTEVSNSQVYYVHGQELFKSKWQYFNSSTREFLQDQVDNAEGYKPIIDEQVQLSISDIKENVGTNDASGKDMIDQIIADVQEAGDYAKDNDLYWAFALYTYITAPAILTNVTIQLSSSTGNTDGSMLSRWFQANSTVLTALDPSGYFSRKYNATFNVFLCTNIMPSMYGFNGDANDYDMIVQYLQTFVDQNINNEDSDIAAAAQDIQSILQADNAPDILKQSVEALQAISDIIDDTLALPYVTTMFVNWFSATMPQWSVKTANIFGGLFVTGFAIMGAFNLYLDFKQWGKMTTEERAEVITNAAQMALQITAAIVKRGVKAGVVATAEGLSMGERLGGVFNILFNGKTNFLKDTEVLDDAMMNVGNRTARWIGLSEGAIAQMAAEGEAVEVDSILAIASSFGEEETWMAKVFGKNLDSFMATRIGPLFIIAGMGYTIYQIASGDTGIALAGDIVNLVGGALMLLAAAGQWAVEAGLLEAEGALATICTCAGPLAIVAALAGLALMLYQIFKKKPDPVADFVNQYVKPAGFYVPAKDSAIDYAVAYKDSNQGDLMMVGFTLGNKGLALCCNTDGSITIGTPDTMPAYVWLAQTDGLGLSKISAITQPPGYSGTVTWLLSLMTDNTISFQPPMVPGDTSSSNPVVTQLWYTSPQNNATLTNGGQSLQSLALQFQPVFPVDNNYAPDQAKGYMMQTANGVTYNADSGSNFTLTMSAMGPNYMMMVDMSFKQGTIPAKSQHWAPAFGMLPSYPITYENTGNLPPFLTFDSDIGSYIPNGQKATDQYQSSNSIKATNSVGSASANFTIQVVAPASIPNVVPQLQFA